MSNNVLMFYYIAVVWSNLMLIPALILFALTLPKIIKESRVHNGLLGFRKLLLVLYGSIAVLAFVAIIIIDMRFVLSLEYVRYISFVLLIVFTTGKLISAIAIYKVYGFNFSDKQKLIHKKLELEENKNVTPKKTGGGK